jgi:hypothetical protein
MLLRVAMVMLNANEWMRVKHYFSFMNYLVSHMNRSKERPAVLLDNHDLYLSIAALDYCKDLTCNLFTKCPLPIDDIRQS